MRNVVTITLSPSMDKKVRKLQSELIQKTLRSWSYSKTLELVLESGMKSVSSNKMAKDVN